MLDTRIRSTPLMIRDKNSQKNNETEVNMKYPETK